MRDRLRREWYLARFAWHMQDYPQKPYRRIKADLRREIEAAAADVGMRAALRGLGHPHVLAQDYHAELERPVPRWGTGAVAAALVVSAFPYLTAAYALGGLQTLEATGGGTATVQPVPGTTLVLTATPDAFSAESTVGLAGIGLVLGLGVAAFLLGARAWRLLR